MAVASAGPYASLYLAPVGGVAQVNGVAQW